MSPHSWRTARRLDWRIACLAGLAAAAVSGCGGSSGSPSTKTPTTPASPTAVGSATTATQPAGPSGSAGATQTTARSGSTGAVKPGNPTNPARVAFIGRADQICASANAALIAPQKKVNAAFTAEQAKGSTAHRTALAAAVRAESAVASGELARLRALKPPPGDGLVVGRYVAAVASQVQLINQLAAAVAANDGRQLTAVGDKLAAGKSTVDALASAYGFKVCGNVAS